MDILLHLLTHFPSSCLQHLVVQIGRPNASVLRTTTPVWHALQEACTHHPLRTFVVEQDPRELPMDISANEEQLREVLRDLNARGLLRFRLEDAGGVQAESEVLEHE